MGIDIIKEHRSRTWSEFVDRYRMYRKAAVLGNQDLSAE